MVLHNYTPLLLFQESISLAHGTWCLFPPGNAVSFSSFLHCSEKLEPYSDAEFAVTNSGFVGGTVGTVTLRVAMHPSVLIDLSWTNPYVGAKSASYRVRTTDEERSRWMITLEHSQRHQMEVTWSIKRSDTPSSDLVASLSSSSASPLQASSNFASSDGIHTF